jgi:CheY-like chemotaxis protein
MSKLPLKDSDGKVIGVVTTCEDVTDSKVEQMELIKLREDVKKSDRMTKAFLSNITHSIRTPLSAIMGFTDMITQGELDQDEILAFSDILQYNADKLNKVISDTLDVASVEAGALVIKPEPIDIKAFIIEEVKAYSNRVFVSDKAHLEIKTELPEEDLTFEVDHVRLKQVLSNLIGNALQYTEVGEITVGLRIDNKKSVLLYVKDTGSGLDAEKLEIIFERFKLGTSAVDDINSGLGLGLTICKELVNQMGGEIWVESKAGEGSKFSFTLPTGEVDDAPAAEVTHNANYTWKDEWAGKKIILADDVIYAHQFIKALLKKKDIEVISAIDGEEAINLADRHQDAALILMDIQMPRVGGVEAMERVKEKYPEMPIIAYTAYAMSGDSELYLARGFNDYLSKPLETPELLRVFNKFL